MKKNVSFEKEIEFSSMIGDITSISLDHSLEFKDKNKIEGNFLVSGTYKMTEASTLEEKFSYDIPVEIELLETLEEDSRKVSISDFRYEIINDDILKCNIEVLIEGVEEITLEKEEEIKEIEVLEEEDLKRSQEELFKICEEEKDDNEKNSKEEDSKENQEDKKEEKEEKKESVRECDGDIKLEHEIEEKRDSEIKEQMEEKEIEVEVEVEVEVEKEEVTPVEKEEVNTKVVEEVIQEEESMKEEEESKNMSSLFQAFETSEETFTTYSVYIVRKEDTIEKIMETYQISRERLSEYNDLSSIEIGSKVIIPTGNE